MSPCIGSSTRSSLSSPARAPSFISAMAAGGPICIRPRPSSASATSSRMCWRITCTEAGGRSFGFFARSASHHEGGSAKAASHRARRWCLVRGASSPASIGRRATPWSIAHVSEGPKLEALLDDPVWSRARPVFIHTQQGANLGGTGESLVEVRAVHDGEKVYFAFRWEDPTRSLRRIPIIKREDGWYPLDENTAQSGCRRLLRGQDRRHLLRQSLARRFRRHVARASSAPRRQALAAERAGLPLHDRWQLHQHVAMESFARRAARAGSTTNTSAPLMSRARTRRITMPDIRAAIGTRPAGARLFLQLQIHPQGSPRPGDDPATSEGLEGAGRRARQIRSRSEQQR